jgi:hypothetical protein
VPGCSSKDHDAVTGSRSAARSIGAIPRVPAGVRGAVERRLAPLAEKVPIARRIRRSGACWSPREDEARAATESGTGSAVDDQVGDGVVGEGAVHEALAGGERGPAGNGMVRSDSRGGSLLSGSGSRMR